MTRLTCSLCGGKTKRHGKTSAGTQRWQCMSCKASTTHKINNDAKLLRQFLDWLLSRKRQADMPGGGRTFRRKTAQFWSVWPMPSVIDEIHKVIYVDGIYLKRNIVVLIARSDEHILGWYMARSENANAYSALMMRIAPPDMVITDGGPGFAKARKKMWSNTKVQRCTYHVFCQIKRYTTSRPRLQAGIELYGLAKDLLHIKTLHQASVWLERYNAWCMSWAEFLNEKTLTENRWVLTHERLVKARDGLTRLINQGVLFTYLDLELSKDGPLPSTNNKLEGGTNAQLRHMLRDHRGLSDMRRIKAVYWWCYMHSEYPLSPAEILKTMPTDEDIDYLYQTYAQRRDPQDGRPQWGDVAVWHELHKAGPYRMDWE